MTASSTMWTLLGLSGAMVGGVFLTFSDFLMRALGRTTPSGAIEAMQQVNRTVYRSVFLSTFMALVPASATLTLWHVFTHQGASEPFFIVGTASYLIGAFVITAAANVPLNKRLDPMDAGTAKARDYWSTYLRRWLRWNHVRTAASLLAAACWLIGAQRLAGA
ncbi:MAG: anthrone oxygenase family protein [Pseudomonadota bacterium]